MCQARGKTLGETGTRDASRRSSLRTLRCFEDAKIIEAGYPAPCIPLRASLQLHNTCLKRGTDTRAREGGRYTTDCSEWSAAADIAKPLTLAVNQLLVLHPGHRRARIAIRLRQFNV